MKKNLLYLTMAMFMGLFASCSQEDAPTQGLDSSSVSLSAQLPDAFAKTRAVPTADSDHQLRCVLEVWDQASPAALVYREEKLGAGENITFNFNIPEGQKYDCLMWADFVAKEAAITSVTKGEVTYSHYADTYYNTSDLKNIEIVDPAKNFNNDACDAYFGHTEIDKTLAAPTSLDITLGRPFMRLAFKEKVAENYDKCKTLDVSYKMPDGFNVLDGSVASKVTATYNGAPAEKEGDLTLFYNYLFANKGDETLGEIVMTFNDKDAQPIRTVTVQANTPLKRNYKVNAIGNLVDAIAGNTTIVIDFDNKWEEGEDEEVTPENSAKVGDFFYSDGTFSTELDDTKTCVGIVFKVGKHEGDNATYPNIEKVKGYVVALKDAAQRVKWADAAFANPTNVEGINQEPKNNYDGYVISKSNAEVNGTPITQMPQVQACLNYNVTLEPSATTSGWYMPTVTQLEDIRTNIATVNAGFAALSEGTAEQFAGINYWSCVVATSGKIYRAQFLQGDSDYSGVNKASTANTAYNVRAILTF